MRTQCFNCKGFHRDEIHDCPYSNDPTIKWDHIKPRTFPEKWETKFGDMITLSISKDECWTVWLAEANHIIELDISMPFYQVQQKAIEMAKEYLNDRQTQINQILLDIAIIELQPLLP